MKKLGLAPLALAAALLAGCSGSSTSSSSPTSASAGSSVSSSAAASPTDSASSSSSSTASSTASSSASSTATAATDAVDVCAKLSLAEVNRLAGSSYVATTKSTNRCTYGGKDGSPAGKDDGLLTGVKTTSVPLATLVASEKQSINATSSKSVTIDGADDAEAVFASDQGKHVVSVLAKRKDVVFVVITEGTNSSDHYTSAATAVMAALIRKAAG